MLQFINLIKNFEAKSLVAGHALLTPESNSQIKINKAYRYAYVYSRNSDTFN